MPSTLEIVPAKLENVPPGFKLAAGGPGLVNRRSPSQENSDAGGSAPTDLADKRPAPDGAPVRGGSSAKRFSSAAGPSSALNDGPGAVALGKNAKSPSPSQENVTLSNEGKDDHAATAIATRFALQNAARSLMPAERVAGCCRWRQVGRETVDVWHLPEHGRARFGGLQTCGSIYMCPVCGTRISEGRKGELEVSLKAAHVLGWTVVLMTYTVRHDATDSLPALLEGIAAARSYASSGKQFAELREKAGWVGSIRALEVTHGANGWHPHIHELIFLRHDEAVGRLTSQLRRRWETGLVRSGLREVNSHGVDVQIADADIAAYVAKFGRARGWNVEHELTKQVTKRGRKEGSRTPMQLLESYAFGGDRAAGSLWQEYAAAMKGKRQLTWSRGLKAELGVTAPEKSDQDLAEDAGAQGVLLAELSAWQWAVILAHDARARVVGVASAGDAVALALFLERLEWDLTPQQRMALTRAGSLNAVSDVLEGNLTPEQLLRVQRSMTRRGRQWTDVGRSLDEAEARELGLTWLEWRAWQRGGIDAIAVAGEVVGCGGLSAPADGTRNRHTRNRKGVRSCEGQSDKQQEAMFN